MRNALRAVLLAALVAAVAAASSRAGAAQGLDPMTPPPVDAASAASLAAELAQFLELTGKAKKAAPVPHRAGDDDGDGDDDDDDDDDDAGEAGEAHAPRHHRHRHRRHHRHHHRHHRAGASLLEEGAGISEAELDRRAKQYAKWATEYWAPRSMYEHYYSKAGFKGKYYPQPRFAERPEAAKEEEHAHAHAASPPHPASAMDQMAHLGHHGAEAHHAMAYGGPMGGSHAPSLVESASTGPSPYGLSNDGPAGQSAYGPPLTQAPSAPAMGNLAAQFGAPGAQQGAPGAQQQQQQPPMPPQAMQQQAPAPQQAMQPQMPQFRQVQPQPQQAQQQGPIPGMPPTSGTPMPFYAPSPYPPPAPNQVPAAAATVAGAYPQASVQSPTAATMRFAAAGSTAPPPTSNNAMPGAPNMPRYQQANANSYPFGGSMLELESTAVPAGTVHPHVYAAAHHPYRHSLPTPIHAEHMEAFPQVDAYAPPQF